VASKEQIANRALQRLGATRISSLDEGSKNANAVKFIIDQIIDEELRANYWTFAITRAALAADSETPLFDRSYQYQLPNNYLRMAPRDPSYASAPTDWLFEGRKLLTNEGAPLNIRYVRNDATPETYDANFAGAVAMRIAMEIAEEITQSSSKQDRLEAAYKFFVDQAKKLNGIEGGPIAPEIDEMVLVRITEANDPTTRKFSN
jgi:hypothetical protein